MPRRLPPAKTPTHRFFSHTMPTHPRLLSTTATLALLWAVALAHNASPQRQMAVPLTLRRGPPRALVDGGAALPLDGSIRDAGCVC